METLATTRMSSKGQVVIPESIRRQLKLKEGAQLFCCNRWQRLCRNPPTIHRIAKRVVIVMVKSYKYRLYVSKAQELLLGQTLETCRHWYNRKGAYETEKWTVGKYERK